MVGRVISAISNVFLPICPSSTGVVIVSICRAKVGPGSLSGCLVGGKLFAERKRCASSRFNSECLHVDFSVPARRVRMFYRRFPGTVRTLEG